MFSRTTEYALRAMACLALTPDELVPTPHLSRQTQVPANYLAKVLQQLAVAGLLRGRRGAKGGYRLSKPAQDIRLLDVLLAVSEIGRITACPLGLPGHEMNLCPLHRKMDEAAAAVVKVFNGVTLYDLLNDAEGSMPLCGAEVSAPLTVSLKKR